MASEDSISRLAPGEETTLGMLGYNGKEGNCTADNPGDTGMKGSLFSLMRLVVVSGWMLAWALGQVGADWIVASEADKARTTKEAPAPKLFKVEVKHDIAYFNGKNADKTRHKLDLYLPKGQKDFPVLFFVHGGAWRHGDKNAFGYYGSLANFFAQRGIGTVMTNYRLSPFVKHPEHIKDVARAFAYTHNNIAKYGGSPDKIFVSGHSAGGHLAALLATDDSYLRAEGLALKDIKGVIPISGVYMMPDLMPKLLFKDVFGDDAEIRKKAFPMAHCKPGSPPFLIIYARNDFPGCEYMSKQFCKSLKDSACIAETLEIKNRTHITIISKARKDGDPTSKAMLDFIARHTKK